MSVVAAETVVERAVAHSVSGDPASSPRGSHNSMGGKTSTARYDFATLKGAARNHDDEGLWVDGGCVSVVSLYSSSEIRCGQFTGEKDRKNAHAETRTGSS